MFELTAWRRALVENPTVAHLEKKILGPLVPHLLSNPNISTRQEPPLDHPEAAESIQHLSLRSILILFSD
jgi:hypothetical protein